MVFNFVLSKPFLTYPSDIIFQITVLSSPKILTSNVLYGSTPYIFLINPMFISKLKQLPLLSYALYFVNSFVFIKNIEFGKDF